ncbi:MAG: hypothetical protein AAF411_14855 [Myxococcota bacterium]
MFAATAPTAALVSFALHTAGRVLGGEGMYGFTFAGSAVGSALGFGAAYRLLFRRIERIDRRTVLQTTWLIAGGALAGGILGYWASDRVRRRLRERRERPSIQLEPAFGGSADGASLGLAGRF